MELCRTSAAFSWAHSISPSLHFPQRRVRVRGLEFATINASAPGQSQKKNQMIVPVTGATGFIGRRLVQRLLAGIVMAEEREWKDHIQVSKAVVNLAGMPHKHKTKKEIQASRAKITSKVVDIINSSQHEVHPSVLVSALAIGYYGASETQVIKELSPSGNDYLAEVCREWEAKPLEGNKDLHVALIRIGVVLGKDGGTLAKMIPLQLVCWWTYGLGFSWIHLDDRVELIYEALSNPSYKGVINGTAPNPIRLAEMCEHLGNVMGRPSWLSVPELALKAVLGEDASVVRIASRY